MHNVVFLPNTAEVRHRNIPHRFEAELGSRTWVIPYPQPIQFPPYPKHIMPFNEVVQQYNKTFVGMD